MKSAAQILAAVAVLVVLGLGLWSATRGVTWLKETVGFDSDTNRQIRIERKIDGIDAKLDILLEKP